MKEGKFMLSVHYVYFCYPIKVLFMNCITLENSEVKCVTLLPGALTVNIVKTLYFFFFSFHNRTQPLLVKVYSSKTLI